MKPGDAEEISPDQTFLEVPEPKPEEEKKEKHWKLPKDEEILAAIIAVINRNRTIESQNRLRQLVVDELQKNDPEYTTTPEKVRLLALRSGHVRVEVKTKEDDVGKPTKCPVCRTTMDRLKNKTLTGGTVTVEWRCPMCKYWTGKKLRIPRHYTFYAIEPRKNKRRTVLRAFQNQL
ncbi:MAG: hypothetical protein PHH26_09005 [Candidatus Thermoplasmatota archaeon]|nr:hypothetical protein [Candidatus Thermoplasmatota archaeon]